MTKAIEFQEYVKHFTDQVFRADIDFNLTQTYYYHTHSNDLSDLTSDALQIGKIDLKLSLRKFKPSFLQRLFSKKNWGNYYEISNINMGDLQVTISIQRSAEFKNLETSLESSEDLSGKYIVQ